MLSALLAVDDGIWSGNLNFADVLFLIAAIVFAIAAVIAFQVKTLYAALTSVGLCAIAVAWLVL